VVQGGIVPGLFGYEAGQSGVGDIFAWFIENGVPAEYQEEALRRGVGPHEVLEERAARLKPGESGLLALDWWNGNRSTLVDAELSGLLIGQTLATKAPEIYRALIESTAYGTREIIETLEGGGIPVQALVAAGGLPERNQLLMQIYADVTNRKIGIVRSTQAPAVGAAMHAAVAAGVEAGGYPDIAAAAARMGGLRDEMYQPIPENAERYDRIYAEYKTLYDYFGRGGNDVMKRLRAMRREALAKEVTSTTGQLPEFSSHSATEQQEL
jgi:L-ribulokinase